MFYCFRCGGRGEFWLYSNQSFHQSMFSAIVQLLTTTLDFMATLGMQLWVPAIGILNIHMRSFEEKVFSVKSFGPRVGSWAPNVSI